MVLSKNFVESVWSRLEFKAAHAQVSAQRMRKYLSIVYHYVPLITKCVLFVGSQGAFQSCDINYVRGRPERK